MRLAPSSHDIRPGQFVIALGSPLMLSNTVTVGVISAVERDLGHREGLKYLQTDAIITFYRFYLLDIFEIRLPSS
ncbi:unnamed protein product [Dibothriocephalus latus]|uniref:Uncharacterized protein n=1 Tax=Dibothriocephalus latus TaxID=60516 RepID=A0A3P7NVC9_DIBLA|nr:unnamed protein product [Dibothriocephalus latus]